MIVGSLCASTISVEHIPRGTIGTTGSRCARIAVSDTSHAYSTISVILRLADSTSSGVAGHTVIDITVPAFIVDEEGANRTFAGESAAIIVLGIQTDDEGAFSAVCVS